jgi:phosphate transport system permease protein
MTDLADADFRLRAISAVLASEEGQRRIKRRYAAERRFRLYGIAAIGLAITFLVLMLGTILTNGLSAFWQTHIRLDIHFDQAVLDPEGKGDAATLAQADYQALVRAALAREFPDVTSRAERRDLNDLVSSGAAYELRRMLLDDPSLLGKTVPVWLTASDEVDMLVKGVFDRSAPEGSRKIKDNQIRWIDALAAKGAAERQFHTTFFTAGDSREPEQAGIWGGFVGSIYTLGITLLLCLPIGILAAVYLEEFAPKNRWTDLIEVNINNLAAVPSIVFGLLGLAVFLGFFGLPRSAPLVGGMVLALIVLPTIIIAGRASLKAVPPSIREAALGIGASRQQAVWHHVLPLAMPGILTGSIIGMAHALGETAPLLMIGMVAFVVDVPSGPLSPATVLPVQVFMWADSPERAFVEKTSAAIIVLLLLLGLMNAAAIYLRKKFERRW